MGRCDAGIIKRPARSTRSTRRARWSSGFFAMGRCAEANVCCAGFVSSCRCFTRSGEPNGLRRHASPAPTRLRHRRTSLTRAPGQRLVHDGADEPGSPSRTKFAWARRTISAAWITAIGQTRRQAIAVAARGGGATTEKTQTPGASKPGRRCCDKSRAEQRQRLPWHRHSAQCAAVGADCVWQAPTHRARTGATRSTRQHQRLVRRAGGRLSSFEYSSGRETVGT